MIVPFTTWNPPNLLPVAPKRWTHEVFSGQSHPHSLLGRGLQLGAAIQGILNRHMGKSVMFRMRKHGKRHWTEKFRYFSSRTVQQKTFWLRRCYFFQWETEFPSKYASNSGKWVCPTMIVSSTRARVIFPPSQNCTYFKENQTWTHSKICMFQMKTSRRLGFYSNKAPSTRMAPEEISVIRSKALKRPWLRQQLALWLWVKLLVIVSWVICIYIYIILKSRFSGCNDARNLYSWWCPSSMRPMNTKA